MVERVLKGSHCCLGTESKKLKLRRYIAEDFREVTINIEFSKVNLYGTSTRSHESHILFPIIATAICHCRCRCSSLLLLLLFLLSMLFIVVVFVFVVAVVHCCCCCCRCCCFIRVHPCVGNLSLLSPFKMEVELAFYQKNKTTVTMRIL